MILKAKKLEHPNSIYQSGYPGMNAVKRNLWVRGIKARDVCRLNLGYDLLVDDFWKVECKSSLYKKHGYTITNIHYLKFDVLAVALFEPFSKKYKIYYLKNKNDLIKITENVENAVIPSMHLNSEKIETYFTNRPQEIFMR